MVSVPSGPAVLGTSGYTRDVARSRELYQRALRVMPGGSTRGSIFFGPHPLYADSADGCHLHYVDGLDAIDFLNNFTTLVLGHRHPAVMDAVRRQLARGNVFGAPGEGEVRLAEMLASRYPAVEQVVFTSTGSDAIMTGIRLARATTRRSAIAKFEGGYHGGYDYVKVSGMVDPDAWHEDSEPYPVPDTAGLPADVTSQVHIMRFNSISSVETVLERVGNELAVVVLEPVLGVGGLVTPEPGFLQAVRRLCTEHGALLLFDEVITQRLAYGGAQELYGVHADLTAFSKVMSSGFPMGVLGGPAEVMAPLDSRRRGAQGVYYSGTFNANALSVATALATLEAFDAGVIDRINALGARLRQKMETMIHTRGFPVSVTGINSLMNVHFASEPPRDYRSVQRSDRAALRRFHLRMLEEGIVLATRGLASISAPMTETEVDSFVEAAERVLGAIDG